MLLKGLTQTGRHRGDWAASAKMQAPVSEATAQRPAETSVEEKNVSSAAKPARVMFTSPEKAGSSTDASSRYRPVAGIQFQAFALTPNSLSKIQRLTHSSLCASDTAYGT